jgi:uncharacterized protein
MKQITWIALGWLALVTTVQAASFDCAKAASTIEKLICSDDDLSKLDEALSKVYQQEVEQSEDRTKAIKEQRQWLKENRNSCHDADCLKLAYKERIHKIEMTTHPKASDVIDGDWEIVYSCEGATGIYAERCSNGDRDHFELYLWSTGNHLCGVHAATAQLGNRVDEDEDTENPSINGNINNNSATIEFHSSEGATGEATIKVIKNKLYWKVTKQDSDPKYHFSWIIPKEAILLKQTDSKVYQKPDTGCL